MYPDNVQTWIRAKDYPPEEKARAIAYVQGETPGQGLIFCMNTAQRLLEEGFDFDSAEADHHAQNAVETATFSAEVESVDADLELSDDEPIERADEVSAG